MQQPTEVPFRRIAIVGLGVMGGSLARALRRLPRPPVVSGWSPDPEEREAALEADAVDEAPERWTDAVAQTDLVVVAAPLDATCRMLGALAEAAPNHATLTDVASLKVPVERAAAEARIAPRWVGSHPMAGSERSGFAASRPDLYEGAHVWLVAARETRERMGEVSALWRAAGASTEAIGSTAHDLLMVRASHVPQLLANVLASVLDAHGIGPERLGPGGRDMTRLASSSAEVWADLLRHAGPDLADALREVGASTARIADLVEDGDTDALATLMRATGAWRAGT